MASDTNTAQALADECKRLADALMGARAIEAMTRGSGVAVAGALAATESVKAELHAAIDRLRDLASLASQAAGPTMADALAAGDGTLHGAIDYWQQRAQAAEQVRAWAHENDPKRVISAAQKAGALRDGGASSSSIRSYSVPLYTAPVREQSERDAEHSAKLERALDDLDAAVQFWNRVKEADEEVTSNGAFRDALDWLRGAAFGVVSARAAKKEQGNG